MTQQTKSKVCMFVFNSFRPDIRVLKEAQSLSAVGYEVEVMALLDKNTIPYQEYGGVKVYRIRLNPIHLRIYNWVKDFFIHIIEFIRHHSLILSPVRRTPFWNLLIYFFIIIGMIVFLVLINTYGSSIYLILAAGVIIFFVIFVHNYVIKIQRIPVALIKKILFTFHRFFSYYDYYIRCYQRLSSAPSDYYHAHDLNTLAIGWWCKRRFGGKLIYDSHELFTEVSQMSFADKVIWSRLENYLIKCCDHVITVCNCIAVELRERYNVVLPTVIMNCPESNGCLLNKKNLIREAAGINPDTPVILYQGGFSNNRGLRNLLMAVQYFKQGKLVMMGWGVIESELRELVKSNGLQNKVYFIPRAPQEDLLFWSASADVGVIPYRAVGLNNYYSCPNKLFEYINAGLPVAGSAFPEIKKIIDGWDIGKTFDPEDPKDIAAAINYILQNSKRYESMQRNSIKASGHLNWQNESEKLLFVYSQLSK